MRDPNGHVHRQDHDVALCNPLAGHDCLNRSLGVAIMMMGANAGESDYLFEGFKMGTEGLGGEGGAIVGEVRLWYDSIVTTQGFEISLCPQGFVSVQMCLKLDVNEVGAVIHEDTASREHVFVLGLPLGGEESSLGGTDKMIDRNLLAGKEIVGSDDASTVLDVSLGGFARGRAGALLAKLAGSTFGHWGRQATCSSV